MYNGTEAEREIIEFRARYLPIIVTEIIVTLFASFINLLFFIVCFRTLKNKFHNLLVLSLCFTNFYFGLSIAFSSLTAISSFLNKHVKICVFKVFTILFGLLLTYSILFVLCLERYIIVRSRNFGTNYFLNRFKYVFLALIIGIDFMFSLEVIIFFPHEDPITQCSMCDLLGKNYQSFVEVFAVSLSSLLVGIVCITIRTCFLIWKIFFKKNKVNSNQENTHITDCDASESSTNVGWMNTTSNFKFKHRLDSDIGLNKAEVVDEVIGMQIYKEANIKRQKILNLIKIMKQQREMERKELLPRCEIYKPTKIRKTGKKLDTWEVRAFISSVIIVVSTVSFTFPFAFTFWYDIFAASPMSHRIKFFFVFPVILHLNLNPFIFAYRIPEIKKQLKKLLICTN